MIDSILDPYGLNTNFKNPYPIFDKSLIGAWHNLCGCETLNTSPGNPISIADVANFLGQSAPHGMNEFYGAEGYNIPTSGSISLQQMYNVQKCQCY